MRKLTSPTAEWGPALPKHRMLVTSYVPNFVVDPNNDVGPDSAPQVRAKKAGVESLVHFR